MLLKELVEQDRTGFYEGFSTWEEAVMASFAPLKAEGAVTQIYVDSVIDCVNTYGPYIVIAPNIAMPHAQRGGAGVNKSAIAFMKVEKPVAFAPGNPDKDARLFFSLAALDHDEHASNMRMLADLLLANGCVEALLKAKTKEDLLRIDEAFEEEQTRRKGGERLGEWHPSDRLRS